MIFKKGEILDCHLVKLNDGSVIYIPVELYDANPGAYSYIVKDSKTGKLVPKDADGSTEMD